MPEKKMKKTTKTTKNSSKKGKKGGVSLTPTATGAAIGAAVGGVAGAMLSTPAGKKTLDTVADTVKEYAADTIEALQENEPEIRKTADQITATVDKKSTTKK